MQRTYRYRLYPNAEQQAALETLFCQSRLLYINSTLLNWRCHDHSLTACRWRPQTLPPLQTLRRRVARRGADALGYDPASVKVGYEISFTRHFYKPQSLRSRSEIRADILALERENEAVFAAVIGADDEWSASLTL